MQSEDKKEILQAINGFANSVEERFDRIDERFEGVDKRFDGMNKRFDGLEKRVTNIETAMVTKDYLDDKLSDLRGDLVVMMRKEDKKLVKVVEILRDKGVFDKQDMQKILQTEPFAS